MKKIIEIYCCDVCEKEVEGKSYLKSMIIPSKDAETEVDTISTVELCPECTNKVKTLIFGSFATVYTNVDGTVHKVKLPEVEPPKVEPPKVDTTVSSVSTRIIPKAAAALDKVSKAAVDTMKKIKVTVPGPEPKIEPVVEPNIPNKKEMTNEEWAEEVKEMLKNGKKVTEIAAHYGITKSVAYHRMYDVGISPKQYRPR